MLVSCPSCFPPVMISPPREKLEALLPGENRNGRTLGSSFDAKMTGKGFIEIDPDEQGLLSSARTPASSAGMRAAISGVAETMPETERLPGRRTITFALFRIGNVPWLKVGHHLQGSDAPGERGCPRRRIALRWENIQYPFFAGADHGETPSVLPAPSIPPQSGRSWYFFAADSARSRSGA